MIDLRRREFLMGATASAILACAAEISPAIVYGGEPGSASSVEAAVTYLE